ncbi:hypothetical protein ACFL0J_04400 [Candidatus Neomarinimicrobiota bacterium]
MKEIQPHPLNEADKAHNKLSEKKFKYDAKAYKYFLKDVFIKQFIDFSVKKHTNSLSYIFKKVFYKIFKRPKYYDEFRPAKWQKGKEDINWEYLMNKYEKAFNKYRDTYYLYNNKIYSYTCYYNGFGLELILNELDFDEVVYSINNFKVKSQYGKYILAFCSCSLFTFLYFYVFTTIYIEFFVDWAFYLFLFMLIVNTIVWDIFAPTKFFYK